jgi:hypothetical protein
MSSNILNIGHIIVTTCNAKASLLITRVNFPRNSGEPLRRAHLPGTLQSLQERTVQGKVNKVKHNANRLINLIIADHVVHKIEGRRSLTYKSTESCCDDISKAPVRRRTRFTGLLHGLPATTNPGSNKVAIPGLRHSDRSFAVHYAISSCESLSAM